MSFKMPRTAHKLLSACVLVTICALVIGQAPSRAATAPSGEITVWQWKSAWDPYKSSGLLDDFAKAYPDIKLNVVEIAPASLYQKLPLAISAGTGAPDVSIVEDSHLAQFMALGGLTDMTTWVAPYKDKIVPYKLAQVTKDGKYYAMPWDIGPVVTYYRRDVFKAAGLSDAPEDVEKMVDTWDDYLKTCQTIKQKTGDACFPLSLANNDARFYEAMLWQQGLGYVNDKGEVTIDSAANVATLEKLGEFNKAGVLVDQQSWQQTWYDQFAATDKPVSGIVMAAWMGGFLKGWIAPKTTGMWGAVHMPAMAAGQVRSANDGGSTYVIPDQSQNKDAAWAFIQFMLGTDANQVKYFAASDFFPGLKTTYTDDLFKQADPFYGGEQTRQLYVDVANQIPQATVYGQYYSQINGYVSTAIQKYLTGAMSAADALKEAADTVRQQDSLK
jgi:ABC-type glycerol-3-phosphate transport system substrate-binding protein